MGGVICPQHYSVTIEGVHNFLLESSNIQIIPTETPSSYTWNFILSCVFEAPDSPINYTIVYDFTDSTIPLPSTFMYPMSGYITWNDQIYDSTKCSSYHVLDKKLFIKIKARNQRPRKQRMFLNIFIKQNATP